MSLILDALRKMELERKARRGGAAETRTEVLNYRGNPAGQQKSRLLPVIGAVLLLSAAAVAFFLYFRDATPPPATSVRIPQAAPVDKPAQSGILQTGTQPLPAVQTIQPAATNRAPAAATPPAKADDIPQASGDANIAVSGIAWQEERSLRRAVINGSLVSEGAEIAGARIVEIRQNLVRFNRDGVFFEVTYTSGAGK